MPLIHLNGTQLYYEERGKGPETIVFAHSLLCSHTMFKRQIDFFQGHYRCIAFDFRGQGKSAVSKDGYDMDTLAEDAKALIEALNAGPCHFLGLSMGGFVGLRLATRYPELLKSLILMDTSMDPEEKSNISKYKLLAFFANILGIKPMTGQVIPIMFGHSFIKDPTNKAVIDQWKNEVVKTPKKGIINAVYGVINRKGLPEGVVSGISLPTLILVGENDKATPAYKSQRLQELIPRSEIELIPHAGHLSNLEEPELVNTRIAQFLGHET